MNVAYQAKPTEIESSRWFAYLLLVGFLVVCVMAVQAVLNVSREDPYNMRPVSPRSYLSEDQLIGDRVIDSGGGILGAIHDVIIDSREGRLVYALVSPNRMMGASDEVIPVPWDAMKRNTKTRQFVLNLTMEDLKLAPRFQKGSSPDLGDPCWEGDYRQFYENINRRNQPDDRNTHGEKLEPFVSDK